MVMVEIALTILTTEAQFWANGQKIVIIGALAQNLNSQSSNYRVPSKLSISTIG
jgi:hypothetical protein